MPRRNTRLRLFYNMILWFSRSLSVFLIFFDISCVERMIRCTRYYICLLYHTFYVFARKNILFFYIFLQFHQFLHFVFEGTKTGGLSAEYVCYGLLFLCLTKSVMNTCTMANGLTWLLTITYHVIILRLSSYGIIQRGVQQKCNTEIEYLKKFSV